MTNLNFFSLSGTIAEEVIHNLNQEIGQVKTHRRNKLCVFTCFFYCQSVFKAYAKSVVT